MVEKDPFLNFISDLSEKIKISREHKEIMERVNDPKSSADENKGSLENLLLTIKEKIESSVKEVSPISTQVQPITSDIVKIVPEEENNFQDFVSKLKNILSKPKDTTTPAVSANEQEESSQPIKKYVDVLNQPKIKKNAKTKGYVDELEKIKDGINIEKEDTKVTEIKKLIEEYAEKYIKKAVGIMGETGGGTVAKQFANGGTMDGTLNVTGSYLSGGVNLLDIFAIQPDLDNQTLSYNEANYNLSISHGNTISLSSINTTFNSNSSKYESVFTTVNSLSDSWEESAFITPLQSASASWDSVYTTTNTNSGKWESAIQTVNGTANQIVATNTGTNNHNNQTTLSFAQSAVFPGDVLIPGTLTVTGTATYINTKNLIVDDPIIFLANNNPANLVDTGFVSHFKLGPPLNNTHTGLVRRANQGVPGYWTLFSGLTTEPLTAVNIDWNDKNIKLDTLSANIATNNGTSDNWNSVYTTVNSNSGNYILDGGNTKGANIVVGTNDPFHFSLETNNTRRATFLSSGDVIFGDYTTNYIDSNKPIASIFIKGNNNRILYDNSNTNIFGSNNTLTTDSNNFSYFDNLISGKNNYITGLRGGFVNGNKNAVWLEEGGAIIGLDHVLNGNGVTVLGKNNSNFSGNSFVAGSYNAVGGRFIALSAENIANNITKVYFTGTEYSQLVGGQSGFAVGSVVGVYSTGLVSGIYNAAALVDSKDDTNYIVYLSAIPGLWTPLFYSPSYDYSIICIRNDNFLQKNYGKASVVAGTRNYVGGQYCTVFGGFNEVPSDSSTALGFGGFNYGPSSITLGNSCSAFYASFAGGENSWAGGNASFAFGREYTLSFPTPVKGPAALGTGSTALGITTLAAGGGGIAVGYNSKSNFLGAAALGYSNLAAGQGSFAAGFGSTAGKKNTYTFNNKAFTFLPSQSANFNGYFEQYLIGGFNSLFASPFDTLGVKYVDRDTNTGVITATNIGQNYPVNGYTGFLLSPVNGAFAAGYLTEAGGNFSFTAGNETIALGSASFAVGDKTRALGNYSTALGLSSVALHDRTWIWHGSTNTRNVSTTRTDQFMVSAAGGVYFPGNVGIRTDANDQALTVMGTISTNRHNSSSSWAGFRSTQTSNFTAFAGDYYIVNTTSAPITGFLPQSPVNGTTITFQDSFLQWQTNNFTLNRNGNMIEGLTEDLICDIGDISFCLTYIGGSVGWKLA